MDQTEKGELLRLVLDIASQVATDVDYVDDEWRSALASLVNELAKRSPPTIGSGNTGGVLVGQGQKLYRALHARAPGVAYLILEPPDPPVHEDCPTCKGQRIVGSNKK